MRAHIRKHLEARSKTIKVALAAFNRAARLIGRGDEKLTFEKVIEKDFLSQFDLLRDTRQEVRTKPWADIQNRLLRDRFYKVERAREEIARLNIEIPRIRDWIEKERWTYVESIDHLSSMDNCLAAELSLRLSTLELSFGKILSKLDECQQLSGYTGEMLPNTLDNEKVESDEDSMVENDYLDDVVTLLTNVQRHE
jgi:hypothetical protein